MQATNGNVWSVEVAVWNDPAVPSIHILHCQGLPDPDSGFPIPDSRFPIPDLIPSSEDRGHARSSVAYTN